MGRSDQQWRLDIISMTSDGKRLSGQVYRDGKFWLAELPALDVMTQGKTKDDVYAMVKDLLETLAGVPGFSVHVAPDENEGFVVTSCEQPRRGSALSDGRVRPDLVAQPRSPA